jgi:hypothetical protein
MLRVRIKVVSNQPFANDVEPLQATGRVIFGWYR